MFYLASKLVSIVTGFLYPAYSSYKAVRVNDVQSIETWLMYWVVMACLHTIETTVEWTVNWFPFYYEAKALVIVWLTLPQIQGSTYVYVTYIAPFLLHHETEIDATLADLKSKGKAAGLDYMRRAYNAIASAVTNAILASNDPQAEGNPPVAAQPAEAPPTLQDPMSGPTQQAWKFANSMLRSYGPAALAAGQAMLHPLSSATANVKLNAARGQPVDADSARRKKYDDLAAGGSSGRLYPQEVPRPAGDKRSASASAALVGATGGNSSSSIYSSYTRAQLRQRRLELERELAALEGSSSSNEENDDSAHLRSNVRSRHISAPTSPPSKRMSSTSLHQSSLEGSLYETIETDDVVDRAALPSDWGRGASSRGWKGAPPVPSPSSGSPLANQTATPSGSQAKRSSWFWNSGAGGPSPVSTPDPTKKNA